MSEQQVHLSVAQRIIIKFLTHEGVKPIEILQRLTAQFGDQTLSRARVFAWHKKFKEGRELVENVEHDRRPRTSITEENIRTIRELLERDRRLTLSEMTAQVGISYGSCQTIVTKDLGFRKVCARWVPRLLTAEQKLRRFQVCQELSARFSEEGDTFLNRIVTCDEAWVHHYTPESKQASMEWRRKEEAAPVKAKTRLSAGEGAGNCFFRPAWRFAH
ncbi:Protein GVQW3 [Anthophora plagiata]